MDEENNFVDVCGDEDNKENLNKKNYFTDPTTQQQQILKIKNKLQETPTKSQTQTTTTLSLRKGAPRKEKSLGKLCEPFLERVKLEAENGRDVHLESVARNMNVEKRRIYDIVNVMEALEVMQKTNKSFYKWHGLDKLPELMFALQRDAQKGELPKRIASVERAMCSFTTNFSININEENKKINNLIQEDEDESAFGPLTNRDRCGKNSLAQLCRRFLMVLLCNPNRPVSLDVVSTMLIKDLDSEGFEPPSRSRCRRLYDIANVLSMMNLVQKKQHLFGTKKIPLFIYCGPEPDENPSNAALRMREFTARSSKKLTGSGIYSVVHHHPPVPSPDVTNSIINSPKYLQNNNLKEKEENQLLIEKKKFKKMKMERDEENYQNLNNNKLIPILSPLENYNKRRKMHKVISQQQLQQNKENENCNLPKPLPLHPSTSSFSQQHQLNFCSTENIIIPQQQQILLLPNTYCWPQLQNNQIHSQYFNYQQLQNKKSSPIKNTTTTKVRHSVQSILGFTTNSQKENNSCQLKNPSLSPRAFKPLIIQPQQKILKIENIEDEKENKTIKKRLPFTQRQLN